METLGARLKFSGKDEHKGITFIRNGGETGFVSYKALHERASVTLGGLQEKGLHRGDEAIFLIEEAEWFLVCFWACIQGGIIPVPLSPGKQQEHSRKLTSVSRTLENAVIISDAADINAFTQLYQTTENRDYWCNIVARAIFCVDINMNAQPVPEIAIDKEDIALVQYSSGSTNSPKGVKLTHRNIIYNALDIIKSSFTTATDSSLCWMPLTHDMGLIGFHITSLIAGINQYIIPTSLFIRRPSVWLENAGKYCITQLYSPNFGLQYTLTFFKHPDAGKLNLSSVRIIYNGAEPVAWHTFTAFLSVFKKYGLNEQVILPVYGLAEASVAVTIPSPGKEAIHVFLLKRELLHVGDKIQMADGEKDGVRFVGVGKPLEHCRVRICDGADYEVPDSVIGHIQINGENVTSGYYCNEQGAGDVFTGDGWLRTGDLGFMQEGMLVITGRKKNIFIHNGRNYYYHDIEQIIETEYPLLVGKVAACGVMSVAGQEQLAVFVVYKDSVEKFASQAISIRQTLSLELGIEAAVVIPVKRIPRTTSGKIQYYRLAADWQQGEFHLTEAEMNAVIARESHNTKDKQPFNSNEIILQLLNDILKNEVGNDSNIFASGLNSILAIRITAAINSSCNVALEVNDIFRYPVVGDLINYIGSLNTVGKSEATKIAEQATVPINDEGIYIATRGQRRFFILHNDPAYRPALTIKHLYSLKGDMSLPALYYSFNKLVAKFEAFRTSFKIVNGTVVLQIGNVDETVSCLRVLPDGKNGSPEDMLLTVLQQADNADFDLEKGSLFHAVLAPVANNEYLLLLYGHHIILDSWSLSVIAGEISSGYHEYLQGKTEEIAEKQHFRTFAAEQERMLTTGEWQEAVNYWVTALSGPLPHPVLPFPLKRSVMAPPGFDTKSIVLEKDALISFSREQNATIFQVLTSALNILFFTYTGRCDIIIGTNATGRRSNKWANEVGLFTNTLPLRYRFTPDDSFEILLGKVKLVMLLGLQHQQIPFEYITAQLGGKESYRPELFNILVLYEYLNPDNELSLPGVVAATRQHSHMDRHGFVDFQFEITEYAGHIEVILKHRDDLYESTVTERLLPDFKVLVEVFVNRPQQLIKSFNCMSEKEKNKILNGFNNTSLVYDQTSVIRLIELSAKSSPFSHAITDGHCTLDYATLNRMANRIGWYMKNKLHMGAGSRIGIQQERSAQGILMILAVLKIGAIYVPVNAEWPVIRKQFIAKDAGLDLLITGDEENDWYTAKEYTCNALVELSRQEPDTDIPLEYQPDASAYIIYTSGTTGTPKGVLVTQESFCDYIRTFINYFHITAEDVVIQQSSLSFDLSLEEIFPVLCTGGKLVVSATGGADVQQLINEVMRESVTVISTTPVVIDQLNQSPTMLSSLRTLISGGEALSFANIDNLIGKFEIYNTYGPTESTVCATYHPIKTTDDLRVIGKPITNRTVYILNEQLQPVPVGVLGEIFIGGKGIAAAYINLAELTAERFIHSPFGNNEIIYRTGDIGYWREDGSICYEGRKDQQLKIQGYRIEPAEIENCLMQHPAVKSVRILHKENELQQKYLLAFYTANHQFPEDALRSFLIDRLPRQVVPARYIHMEVFPVNASGKIDTEALLHMADDIKQGYHRASSPIGQKLVEIWEEVLQQKGVGVDDNFFELGGTSLTGIRVLTHINFQFHVQLHIGDLFRHPTIAALERLLPQAKQDSLTPLLMMPEGDRYELSRAQNGLWMLHKLEGGSAVYNIFGAYEMTGRLDIDVLKKIFAAIVARHESLRTSFFEEDGIPKQQVHQQGVMPLTSYDFTDKPDKSAMIEKIIAEERIRNFDPGTWPLARVVLIKLHEDASLLIFSMHHLIADGISAGIFAEEFLELFASIYNGNDCMLPPLQAQYKEYVYREQRMLMSDVMDAGKVFWTNYLKDAPRGIKLPCDFEGVRTGNYQGEAIHFSLPASDLSQLLDISRKQEVTLFTTLLSILNICMAGISGQQDIVLTSPFAGRVHPAFERQIGVFVNALLFRARIDKETSFLHLLKTVSQSVTEVMKHKEYPFELLTAYGKGFSNVRMLFEEGNMQMNDFERVIPVTNELSLRQYEHRLGLSIHDLTFIFSRRDHLRITIEYSTVLFKRESAEIFSLKLQQIITAIINNPAIIIADIDMRLNFELENDRRIENFFAEEESF